MEWSVLAESIKIPLCLVAVSGAGFYVAAWLEDRASMKEMARSVRRMEKEARAQEEEVERMHFIYLLKMGLWK